MTNQPTHFVGLVDCNNFFVSCERLFRPDLAKRPVVVLSSNDGCVVARSQEVKDIGVPMGVPLFQIKDIIKDNNVAVFSSNFTLYRDISRRVFAVVRQHCEVFEQYSIDEAFFRVPVAEAAVVAQRIKDSVAALVGMPVSVGVAPSKTLAKYASKQAKRAGGVAIMPYEAWCKEAVAVPLGALWGVGSRRLRAFAGVGLLTATDLMQADEALVRRRFGVEGARLQCELRGMAAYVVGGNQKQQQSIMHSRSFGEKTKSFSVVADAVAYHLRRGVEDLEDMGLCAQFITVFIGASRYEQSAPGWGNKTVQLSPPTNNMFTLMEVGLQCVKRLYDPAVAYQKAGVVLSGLRPYELVTAPLQPSEHVPDHNRQQLPSVVQALNNRFGADAVRLGFFQAHSAGWQARRNTLSPAYTTRWSDIRLVYT